MKKSILNFGEALNKKELQTINGGDPFGGNCEGEIIFEITTEPVCINFYRGVWCGGNLCAVCSV